MATTILHTYQILVPIIQQSDKIHKRLWPFYSVIHIPTTHRIKRTNQKYRMRTNNMEDGAVTGTYS